MESGFDLSFKGGVEASEGIVAGGVEFTLLVDVILVVLFADGVDAEEDVYDAHFLGILVEKIWKIEGNDERRRRRKESLGLGFGFSSLPLSAPAIVSVCGRENKASTV